MTSREPIIHSAGRRTVEILLWCGAALGAVSIVSAIAAVIFGIVPLVFTSGSMSPKIPTGSLGLARTVAASELQVGDVVSVTAANETRVTHRVVATEQQVEVVVLTLKGDTNPSPDQESYRVTEADRVFLNAPHLGRVIMMLTSPWGMFLGGLAAATLLFWAFRRWPPSTSGTDPEDGAQQLAVQSAEPQSRRADNAKIRVSATLLAVGISALLTITTNSGTAAYWTDDATVTTTGFSTHRLLQPNSVTCTASTGSSNTITLTTSRLVVGEPERTDYTYWARAYTAAGVAVSNYKQMTPGNSPTTTFNQTDLPTITTGTQYTFRIHSRLRPPGIPGPTGETGWESEQFRPALFSLNGAALVCGQPILPPVIVFTQPTNNFDGDKTALQVLIDRDCNKPESLGSGMCGTAIDNGSVTSVQYILKRTRGGASYCWNGSTYIIGGAACNFRDTNRVEGDRWIIPGYVYPGLLGWNYTLTIKAIDNLKAVSEKSITFWVQP